GASAAVVVAAVRAISGNTPKFVGAAVRDPTDLDSADIVAAAAGAARATPAPRVLRRGRAAAPAERWRGAARGATTAVARVVSRGAAVALAEQWRGAAQGATSVVALVVGDHVSAGCIERGRVFEGAHGLAGGAGWLAMNPVERDDYRRSGGLEAEIGPAGIVRRLVWRLRAGDMSAALDLAGGDLPALTVEHVFDAARGGDGVAVSVVRDTARYVGMAIANLVAILDPEIVVLGGLIAEAGDLLVDPARAEAVRRMSPALG